MALKIRLDFIFYLFLMLSAIRLPRSMASVVSWSTLAFRQRLRSWVSTQYDSKIPSNSPKRLSSGSSSTRPSRRLKFSSSPTPANREKLSCYRCTPSRSSDSTPTRKSSLKDSSNRVTSSKKATMQFCCGRARIDSAGRTWAGSGFFLGRKAVRAGWRLLSSAIFFFRKLFSRFSCSISIRQQRSQSISDSESEKLWTEFVCSESSKGSRGTYEQIDRFAGVLYIINKIAQFSIKPNRLYHSFCCSPPNNTFHLQAL